MQLELFLDDRAETLLKIHQRLKSVAGPFVLGCRLDPISQLVKSFLGARTYDAVSLKAFEALWFAYGSWEAVRDSDISEVHHFIRKVTYAEVKAPRLIAILQEITHRTGRLSLSTLENLSVPAAFAWLETLPGIGRKTSAAVLNFSTLHKPSLIIDTHHLRILKRFGFVGRKVNFEAAYDGIMPLLPDQWDADDFEIHHILMKSLGQAICTARLPKCKLCPIQDFCRQRFS